METVVHSNNDFATVAYLRINGASLEDKLLPPRKFLHVPPLLSDDFMDLRESLEGFHARLPLERLDSASSAHLVQTRTMSSRRSGPWFSFTDIEKITGYSDVSVENEVEQCFDNLRGK